MYNLQSFIISLDSTWFFEFHSPDSGNSLILDCLSPSAHNIVTSKVVAIFTVHLKRGYYGPSFSPNAFNGDFGNCTRLKRCFSWHLPEPPRAEWSFDAEFVPLLMFCNEAKAVTLPFCVFTRYDYTRNYIYRGEKNLDRRKCII